MALTFTHRRHLDAGLAIVAVGAQLGHPLSLLLLLPVEHARNAGQGQDVRANRVRFYHEGRANVFVWLLRNVDLVLAGIDHLLDL